MAVTATFVTIEAKRFKSDQWNKGLNPTKVGRVRSGSGVQIYTLQVVGDASVAKSVSGRDTTALSSNGGACSSSKSSPSAFQSYGKRQRDDNDDEDDDNRSNGNKRRVRTPKQSLSGSRKLACPYYKRDVENCQKWRSCSGPGWDTVHRVKEHVYRRHALPVRCRRCGSEFETDALLEAHEQETEGCTKQVLDIRKIYGQGYSKSQEKALKSRKRTAGMTEEDKWIEMYRILFPDERESPIPSPYYDVSAEREYQALTKFKDNLVEELPRTMWERMRGFLEEVGYGALSAEAAISLQSQIFDIVRSSTERAMIGSPPDTGLQCLGFGEETHAQTSPGRPLATGVDSPPVDGTCRSEPPTRSNTETTVSNDVASRVDSQTPGWYAPLTPPDTVNHPNDLLEDFPSFENWPTNGL